MTVIETQFPVTVSFGASGGPEYSSSVISMRSGQEKRNTNWTYPRHKYDASTGVQTIANLEDVIAFFHVVQGRAHSFRWKDWADYKSCKVGSTAAFADQSIGTGDGSTAAFQLIKTYSFGASSVTRNITKPVSGTVLVAVAGVQTTAFTVDTTTGIITFDTNTWTIVDVDTGNDWIAVDGDKTGDITDGDSLEITGSTGNDGVYTIDSTTYDAGDDHTEITVTEGISDATVDGSVKYGQPNDGAAITAGYEFDVHCRMDTDELMTNIKDYQAGIAEIPVIEIKSGS